MAAIDTVDVKEYLTADNEHGIVKEAFRAALWQWYVEHVDDVVFSFLFVKKRVKDLHWIFVALLGSEAS